MYRISELCLLALLVVFGLSLAAATGENAKAGPKIPSSWRAIELSLKDDSIVAQLDLNIEIVRYDKVKSLYGYLLDSA